MKILKKHKEVTFLIFCMVLLIGIPTVLLYLLNNGNPYYKHMVDKYIPAYIEKQGYSLEDIDLAGYTEPSYLINKDYLHGHYEVIFKDEPNMTYFYGVKKWSHDVKQFCEKDELLKDGVTDLNKKPSKHTEKDCIRSLDNKD